MTKADWMKKVEENKDVLRDLIARYHPVNLDPHDPNEAIDPSITAPNAERACELVRGIIRKEDHFEYPEVRFTIALEKEDSDTIYSLLSSAWFGVPESTSCWSIPGFSVAVDLLDDPIME